MKIHQQSKTKVQACEIQVGDVMLSWSDDYETDYREVIDIQPTGYDLSGVAIWCEELDSPMVFYAGKTCSIFSRSQ